jgi:hypothetical protein
MRADNAAPARSASGAKTTKITLFAMESSRQQHVTVLVFNNLREKFVTWRNNGILPPINEFARPYQSKSNGIYAVCKNGELSSLLGIEPAARADWINLDPARRRGAGGAR